MDIKYNEIERHTFDSDELSCAVNSVTDQNDQ